METKTRLFDTYRCLHEQGFVPIFVIDDLDSRMLLDACLDAGLRCIEYTLRRRDAHEMIPWIRENYPDLHILAGSTMDSEDIVRHARRHFPQTLTLAELDEIGVDGFVSMLAFDKETIRRYCGRRLLAPCAMTSNEAFFHIRSGAHFAKLIGPDLGLVKTCRAVPMFDYCPIMVTGGMNTDRIPGAVDAGAVVIGTGFDLLLRDMGPNVTRDQVTRVIREYVQVTADARARKWPGMAAAIGSDSRTWLDSLPHYHPFQG